MSSQHASEPIEFLHLSWVHNIHNVEKLSDLIMPDSVVFYENVATKVDKIQLSAYLNQINNDPALANKLVDKFREKPDPRQKTVNLVALAVKKHIRIKRWIPVDLTRATADEPKSVTLAFTMTPDMIRPQVGLSAQLLKQQEDMIRKLLIRQKRDLLTCRQIDAMRIKIQDVEKITLIQGINHRAGREYKAKHPEINFQEITVPEISKVKTVFRERIYEEYTKHKYLSKDTIIKDLLSSLFVQTHAVKQLIAESKPLTLENLHSVESAFETTEFYKYLNTINVMSSEVLNTELVSKTQLLDSLKIA